MCGIALVRANMALRTGFPCLRDQAACGGGWIHEPSEDDPCILDFHSLYTYEDVELWNRRHREVARKPGRFRFVAPDDEDDAAEESDHD